MCKIVKAYNEYRLKGWMSLKITGCSLKEGDITTERWKNHAEISACFIPLSLFRTDHPAHRFVDAQNNQLCLFD